MLKKREVILQNINIYSLYLYASPDNQNLTVFIILGCIVKGHRIHETQLNILLLLFSKKLCSWVYFPVKINRLIFLLRLVLHAGSVIRYVIESIRR